MFRRGTIVVAFSCLAVLCVSRVSAQYYITDIGTLGTGPTSYAYGVNSLGQVTGYSTTAVNESGYAVNPHTFIYSNGTMTDIGPLFSYNPLNYGYGINANGQVTGCSKFPGTPTSHAYVYNGGTMTDLSAVPGAANGVTSRGYSINDNGQVAGYYVNSSGYLAAFVYSGGTTTDLGAVGAGYNYKAYAINSSGVVVGSGMAGGIDPTDHGFVWDSVHGMQPLMPGNPSCWAYGINDSGQVVGNLLTNYAYLYKLGDASYTNLGSLGTGTYSIGYGINNAGQVVGTSTTDSGGATQHAFVWSGMTGMQDLNAMISPTSGWTLTLGRAISGNGYIAGTGTNAAGQTHGFLLTPALGGDANLDGVVNISDLSKVLTNYDKSGQQWADGDFDDNGAVDIQDLSKVLTNYDKTAGTPAAGLAAVPEPSSLVLVIAAGIGLLTGTLGMKRGHGDGIA